MTLEEYLLQQGVSIEPTRLEKNFILENPELLRAAAELWEGRESILTSVVQARIDAVSKKIVEQCLPVELPSLRHTLVELSALLEDMRKYSAEYARQEAKAKAEATRPEQAGL